MSETNVCTVQCFQSLFVWTVAITRSIRCPSLSMIIRYAACITVLCDVAIFDNSKRKVFVRTFHFIKNVIFDVISYESIPCVCQIITRLLIFFLKKILVYYNMKQNFAHSAILKKVSSYQIPFLCLFVFLTNMFGQNKLFYYLFSIHSV